MADKYTRKEAIEIVLRNCLVARQVLKKILDWDKSLDSHQLAYRYKTSRGNIYNIARKYGLKFINKRESMITLKTATKIKIAQSLYDQGITYEEIRHVLGCSKEYVRQLLQRNSFNGEVEMEKDNESQTTQN